MKKIIISMAFVLTLYCVSNAQTSYNLELEKAAAEIAKKITVSGKTSVAVLDFENSNNQISELGSWLASVFTTHLENNSNNAFAVKNRTDIEKAIQQIKSESGSGAYDSKTIQRLGEISGSDVIVYGAITLMDDEITVNIRTKNISLNSTIGGVLVSFTATDGMRTKYDNYIESKTTPSGSVSPATIRSGSGEGSERSSKDPNCKEKDTGDYCFTNQKSMMVEINYRRENATQTQSIGYYGGTRYLTITVEPGQTSCIYELKSGVYSYTYKDPTKLVHTGYSVSYGGDDTTSATISGQFLVERCKSKLFIIK